MALAVVAVAVAATSDTSVVGSVYQESDCGDLPRQKPASLHLHLELQLLAFLVAFAARAIQSQTVERKKGAKHMTPRQHHIMIIHDQQPSNEASVMRSPKHRSLSHTHTHQHCPRACWGVSKHDP